MRNRRSHEDRLKPGLPRDGFTLVELMVAAALSLVIMTIMALAFQSAMGTLSNLKATGDLADRLRTAEVMLRADLDADHVTVDDHGGSVRVGDLRFDQTPAPVVKGGYFIVTTAAGINEGIDSDGIVSTQSNGPTNSLTMTVRRNSKTSSDLFGYTTLSPPDVTDTLGATTDGTQWAEVKWHLSPAPRMTVGGVNMYSLHRTVRPYIGTLPKTPNAFNLDPNGDDIVLTNVVSFEVKPLLVNSAGTPVGTTIDPPYAEFSWNTASTPAPTTRCIAVLVKIAFTT